MLIRRLMAAVVVLVTVPLTASAQKPKTTFVDAKSAGPDFVVQGEYVGTIGEARKLGIQVIALGKGRFNAVMYAGGLPGAGWDAKTRTRLSGQTVDGKVTFKGRNITGQVAGGVFSGGAEDDVRYEAKKASASRRRWVPRHRPGPSCSLTGNRPRPGRVARSKRVGC